jgi:hypothetical protein
MSINHIATANAATTADVAHQSVSAVQAGPSSAPCSLGTPCQDTPRNSGFPRSLRGGQSGTQPVGGDDC